MGCGKMATTSDDKPDDSFCPTAVVAIFLDCGINPQVWNRDWVDLLSMVGEIEEARYRQ
jgi:hypothetical protein